MPVSLTGPAADVVAAINARNVDAFLSPFVDDAIVNDRHRQLRGRDAVRNWYEQEIARNSVTFEVVDVREHYGDRIVSGPVTGAVGHDRLALYFSVRDNTIVRLVVLPMAGHPAVA